MAEAFKTDDGEGCAQVPPGQELSSAGQGLAACLLDPQEVHQGSPGATGGQAGQHRSGQQATGTGSLEEANEQRG